MKLLLTNTQTGRAPIGPERAAGDDTLGRGMELALTIGVFAGIGWLLDRWLEIFPAMTIGLVLFAAIGTFVRMKIAYDARMDALEAERRNRRVSSPKDAA